MKILGCKIVCDKCGAKNGLYDLDVSFSDNDNGIDIDFVCRECGYVEYVFIEVEDFIEG